MRWRCTNPNSPHYPNYGGRGITVCPEWSSFERFIADMGRRPPGMTLERKENDGPYTPGNCIWATPTQQARNKRVQKKSTSGVTGVSFDKSRGKWMAHIEGKSLGRFATIPEAAAARRAAETRLWGTP